jgi:hypothetical protein
MPRRCGTLVSLVSLVSLAALLVLGLWPASAPGYKRAHVSGFPGRFLYWPTRNIEYVVNKQGCKDVSMQETLGAIKRAFFAWASPSCTDIYFFYKGLSAETKTNLVLGQDDKPDSANLLVWHTTWPPKGVTSGGVTKEMPAVTTVVYSTDSGVIMDADIDLNAHDFFWTSTDDTTKAATDVENIVAHEIGHLLGLSHSSEKEATMWEATHQGELKKRSLHADDQLGLCTIYPFGKSTPTGSGQGSIPQDVEGGCAVAAGGRSAAACPLLLLVCLWLLRQRRLRQRRLRQRRLRQRRLRQRRLGQRRR